MQTEFMQTEPIKILIADDNDTDRMILQTIVAKQGHEVVIAKDGVEAIEQFQSESPQIVLLDALMPRMNGFEAAVKIKELAGETLVPIIFLTSLKDADSLAKGLRAGGDDFLSKPYNQTILKAKIDSFNRMRLNHQHLQKALENLEKSQTRLVEREKMASLGELVAGIAHEVNTPIGIGITAISHLDNTVKDLSRRYQAETLTPSDLETFIQEALEGVGITQKNIIHAAELIKSFKQVAVDQTSGNKRKVNLKQHFLDILLSLRPQLNRTKHSVQVHCDESIHCTCNAGALTQIVTNLVMNSLIHGFEGIEQGSIDIFLTLENTTIKLIYKDDGVGMQEELLQKIFEPFFTTKRGQGGSGLGTHIIYNQVNQALGGEIAVSSSPGEGIEFSISFPQQGP